MKTIYIGHPISGLSYEEVMTYYTYVIDQLKNKGYNILHPMLGKEALRTEIKFRGEGYGTPISNNHAIKCRDKWMVYQADIILMDYTGAPIPSIGCASELAYADAYNKHVVTVVTKDNPNYHAFVLDNSHIVFDTLEDALIYLGRLI